MRIITGGEVKAFKVSDVVFTNEKWQCPMCDKVFDNSIAFFDGSDFHCIECASKSKNFNVSDEDLIDIKEKFQRFLSGWYENKLCEKRYW